MRRASRIVLVAFLGGSGLVTAVTPASAQQALTQVSTPESVPHLPRSRPLREARAGSLPTAQSSSPTPGKRHDSLLNGVLIGAGIGALVGLIPDYYDDCEECHDSLYGSIAVGAGIGLLVDALRTDRTTVTHATPERPVRIHATVGKRRSGIGATIRWR